MCLLLRQIEVLHLLLYISLVELSLGIDVVYFYISEIYTTTVPIAGLFPAG